MLISTVIIAHAIIVRRIADGRGAHGLAHAIFALVQTVAIAMDIWKLSVLSAIAAAWPYRIVECYL